MFNPKTNGAKAFLAVLVAVAVFLGTATAFGGWSAAGPGPAGKLTAKEGVVQYFERMPDHIYKISEPELKQLVDAQSDLYLLDIREPKDYAAGHIQGANNIPFREVGRHLEQLPKNKLIVVYCYTGQTGGQTVAALNIAGFKARSLNGGMNNGWKAKNYPVVTN